MSDRLKTRYLIINNHHDYGCNQYYFKVIGNGYILESAFLSAVKEYYDSPAGEKIPQKISRSFGWSNVIEAIPTPIWEKHGLEPIKDAGCSLLEYKDINGENIFNSCF